jgi:small subunit ribosomal protein S6
MKRYETIVIIDPDLNEEQRTPLFTRFEEIISKGNGVLVQNDQWGSKKLAYDIKKKNRGYYSRFDYCGTPALVDEMERVLRIEDGVLKYMTVLQSPVVELDKIEEEKAQLQALADEKKAQAEAQAEADEAEPAAAEEETVEASVPEEAASEPETASEPSEFEDSADAPNENVTEETGSTKEEQA